MRKIISLSFNIIELDLYQDQVQKKWKHKLSHIEVSRIESDRVADLIMYKNHYALFQKLQVLLWNHKKVLICRRRLNSYTIETMLKIHKPKCNKDELSRSRTSSEPHFQGKNLFHKGPFCFRKYSVFEADNEINISRIGYKTTILYEQNPVRNGYYIVSEINDL